MYILTCLFILIVIAILLGHFSYSINTLKKGSYEFLPKLNYIKEITYIGLILLLYNTSGTLLEHYLVVFIALLFLSIELKKEFKIVQEHTPSHLTKIIFSLLSLLAIIDINEYMTSIVGISLSNISISISSIIFLLTTTYFGGALLLIIAFFIEIKIFYSILRIEKARMKLKIWLYNLLADKKNIKIDWNKTTYKHKTNRVLIITTLQLYLTITIFTLNKSIFNHNHLEKIIVTVAYSSMYDGCSNIERKPFHKMMFLDMDNVSIAIPTWDNSIPHNKQEESNIRAYKFNYSVCNR